VVRGQRRYEVGHCCGWLVSREQILESLGFWVRWRLEDVSSGLWVLGMEAESKTAGGRTAIGIKPRPDGYDSLSFVNALAFLPHFLRDQLAALSPQSTEPSLATLSSNPFVPWAR
jgi:hypothetical protein